MKTTLALCIAAAGCIAAPAAFGQNDPTADQVVDNVVDAAEHLIGTLNETQRKALMFSFDDQEQRRRWSNLPVTMVERRGLRMGDLTEEQKAAVFGMLKATLSQRGFQQVIDNMNGDELLNQRGGRGRPMFGKDEYFVSILGEPSTSSPWMWQFGGHHLAINATIAGDQITLSPSLTGGQPVDYELEGRQVRQLAGDEDKSFALVNALTNQQLEQAAVDDEITNLAYGPTAENIEPRQEGIKAADLDANQQAMLVELIRERIGILNEVHAEMAMKEIVDTLPETYFAWFGPTQEGSAASYRIQGPRVIIEYAPQHLGGDLTEHTHAMYRDPTNDYGAAIVDR